MRRRCRFRALRDCGTCSRFRTCVVAAMEGDDLLVRFAQRQRAATPGQSVVFYFRDECLGA
ncbi:aminomethyltransferase beta-barrel domain-containing protein [Chromatium okenii]|uniref:aminomethyltransferase beta-barrel domain-containing protein n=1 Tax=Chromatium okenii TaxID=61644 RepID=UPI003B82DAE8